MAGPLQDDLGGCCRATHLDKSLKRRQRNGPAPQHDAKSMVWEAGLPAVGSLAQAACLPGRHMDGAFGDGIGHDNGLRGDGAHSMAVNGWDGEMFVNRLLSISVTVPTVAIRL